MSSVSIKFIPSAKFKTAVLCALVHRPLRRDEVTRNALLPGVLRRGCAKYPSLQGMRLAEEDLYGSLFGAQAVKKGERQILQFFLEAVPKDGNFYRSLELLGEYMLRPLERDGAFLPEIVAGEKENLRADIAARINSKAEYARFRCLGEMCAEEPFGIPGDGFAEDLDGISGESLLAGWRQALSESPADFVCVGDLDGGELERRIREIFDLPGGETIGIPDAEIRTASGEVKTVKEEADATQGRLCMGLRCGVEPTGKRFYALQTANEIIGGGANSKLFSSLREKNSLCYTVGSVLYRFKSIMLIQSGVSTDKLEEAAGMITREIEKIKSGEITEEDLANAKSALTKKYRSLQDYPSAVLDYQAAQSMLREKDSLDDVVNRLNGITVGDVLDSLSSAAADTVYLMSGKDRGKDGRTGEEASQ
ncbi:MAG: insulinase family protein [Firmicutes bacterium]|nr:insulinase family protein [Bacillota bacterium]